MGDQPKGTGAIDATRSQELPVGLERPDASLKKREPFRTRSVSLGRSLIGDIVDISEVLVIAEGEDHK